MRKLIQNKIIAVTLIIAAIVFIFGSAQFVWMKIHEKENITFFQKLDTKQIDQIVVTEIVKDNDNHTKYIFLQRISKPEIVVQFGKSLNSIDKLKSGEKPLSLRTFLLTIDFSNGSNKELITWIQKIPNDRVFIQFVERFEYVKGLVKGEKVLGFAESKELLLWLGNNIKL